MAAPGREYPSWPIAAGLAVVLILLAMVRPLDHDESQYIAAAILSQQGWPYRDFAYLQTPLQPLLFAPLSWLAGDHAWLALRATNAILGAGLILLSGRAMLAAGVSVPVTLLWSALLAGCDIFLFSTTVARNDALPGFLLALALLAAIRIERGEGGRWFSIAAGVALAAAAAVKISYAIPAAAYGCYALVDRRHRPVELLIGALPACALIGYSYWQAPAAFMFGILQFPAAAPAEYYEAIGRPEKLSAGFKMLDMMKFLALGTALPALILILRRRVPGAIARICVLFLVAGLLAAVLPSPTWRQYLLPALSPLFVLAALAWQAAPVARPWRAGFALFAVAGLIPTVFALSQGQPSMATATQELRAVRGGLQRAGVTGGVATLSPQFLPASARMLDPRWAAGPFYFRSRGLLSATQEADLALVSRETLPQHLAVKPPRAMLVGGEGPWTSGNVDLDHIMEKWALASGWTRVPLSSQRLRLYVPPAPTASGTN